MAQQLSTSQAERHAGHHGAGRYWIVWGILLIFTGLTVWTGRMDLGGANILLALTIASIKATLVVLFFMHMTEAAGANRIVFVVSIVFALVMMIGVFGDLWTRNEMTLPSQTPFLQGADQEKVEAIAPGHRPRE